MPDAVTLPAPAQLNPLRLFPGGGYTLDGQWIVEMVEPKRVDVTRTSDGAVVTWADTSIAGALSAIAQGWVAAELERQETRRA